MALTTEATTNIPASKTPSGFTPPVTTITFTGVPNKERFQVELAAAALVDPAVEADALTNVVNATKSWIDATFAVSDLKLDLTQTIDGIITITDVVRSNGEDTTTSKIYLTGTDSFTVTGVFEYE